MNQEWKEDLRLIQTEIKKLSKKHITKAGLAEYLERFPGTPPYYSGEESESTEVMSSSSQEEALAREEADCSESPVAQNKPSLASPWPTGALHTDAILSSHLNGKRRKLTGDEISQLARLYATKEEGLSLAIEQECRSHLAIGRPLSPTDAPQFIIDASSNKLLVFALYLYEDKHDEYQRYQWLDPNRVLFIKKSSGEPLRICILSVEDDK
jgi:hypothetical protein